MKKILLQILLFAAALMPAVSLRAATGTLFDYPVPPDSVTELQPRCDYIVERFWDRCNFDLALRNPDKFNTVFGDWVGIMPYASSEVVHSSIDKLMKRFEKKGADETLTLATMAEQWLYSDTAQLRSEEILLPFVTAAANHKKIKKEDRRHFQALEKMLTSSMVGSIVPDVPFIYPDGHDGSFADVKQGSVLLYIYQPDDINASLTRIKLDTDRNARELIEAGQLAIVTLYPGEPDERWRKDVESFPSTWVNVAAPQASEYFDLRRLPAFYFLNTQHKVLARDLDADYLLGAFKVANEGRKRNEK